MDGGATVAVTEIPSGSAVSPPPDLSLTASMPPEGPVFTCMVLGSTSRSMPWSSAVMGPLVLRCTPSSVLPDVLLVASSRVSSRLRQRPSGPESMASSGSSLTPSSQLSTSSVVGSRRRSIPVAVLDQGPSGSRLTSSAPLLLNARVCGSALMLSPLVLRTSPSPGVRLTPSWPCVLRVRVLSVLRAKARCDNVSGDVMRRLMVPLAA
uniref:Orf4 protein n=1 Tax=Fowl adenovirus A serotype 1 (strain CELO / Phelps) TaxID=10553 RepID=Q64788_ADEG1|nr:orf4 [Fowl aviadenovirus 1]